MDNATTFQALVVREEAENTFTRSLENRTIGDLPEGDVLVRVAYSSLNYKDGLSASGNRGVTRKYPHTPGIDAAGTVVVSNSENVGVGNEVIVTSYDLGMNTSGGFGEYIRVPAEWIVPMPAGLDARVAMMFGTAGLTAGMSVWALSHVVPAGQGEVLVTGASGGVGSLAVAILAKLGYQVVAVSGKASAIDFLKGLGASRVLSREEALAGNERPILKAAYSGVVDTVGGDLLAAAIKSTDLGGVVTCCGNVASPQLAINVFPFILRGVSLIGIDSQNYPMERRRLIWEKLAGPWKPDQLADLCREVTLNGLAPEIERILQGQQQGRVVVKVSR